MLHCASQSARVLVSTKIPFPRAYPPSARFRSGHRSACCAAPVVSRRCLSSASVGVTPSTLETADNLLPDRLLTAALPFVPSHGFSSATILAGAASQPELGSLGLTDWTLSGLFPSTTTAATLADRTGHRAQPIGPAKALAERWIQEGNSLMKSTVRSERLVFKQHGLGGVRRAFEIRLAYNRTIPHEFLLRALALVVTPKDPFFGVPLPVELPHILPYGSHALDVATDALAGLCDYSKSREWMLRRIRLAGVYSAIGPWIVTAVSHSHSFVTLLPGPNPYSEFIQFCVAYMYHTWAKPFALELMSIGSDIPPDSMPDQIQKLLDASESLATHTGNTVEFINYVNRSQRSIIRSFGLI